MENNSFFVKTSQERTKLLEKIKSKSLESSKFKTIVGGYKWIDLGSWSDKITWPDNTWIDLK